MLKKIFGLLIVACILAFIIIRFVPHDIELFRVTVGGELVTHLIDDRLINALDLSMQARAIELSKARHYNSTFEEISLTDRDIEVVGTYIYMVNTYRVIMRGNILGIVRNIVDVTVRGQINVLNNSTQVLEANIR
jgi:hypothetical protein